MNILNLEAANYSENAVKKLKKIGNYYVLENFKKKNYYLVDTVITRLKYLIDKSFLNKFPNLKFILCNTTGIDHINLNECYKKKIKVLSLKSDYNFMTSVNSTAEFTFGLIISLIRKIPFAHAHVMKFKWNRNLFLGQDLKNKTIGIIGFGRNGKKIAKYASAFEMKVYFYDKSKIISKFEQIKSLKKILSLSDVLVFCVTLNSTSKKILNLNNIKYLKKNSFLINTSRGEIICERALLKSLKNKILAGAALDVVSDEYKNKKKNLLINYAKNNDNLIITPHIGGANFDAWQITENRIVDKFIDIIKDKK